jgi:PAS domain S-box-containing protein
MHSAPSTDPLFRAIVENSPDLIAAVDGELRFSALNAAMREGLRRGLGRDVQIGEPLEHALARFPGERDLAVGLCRRALAGEEVRLYRELPGSRAAPRAYDIRLSLARDGQGAAMAVVVSARPAAGPPAGGVAGGGVSDAAEERLALAQRLGRFGLFEWDPSTAAVHWSRELEELFGLPPGEFEGTLEAWARRLHPDDGARFLTLLGTWTRERRLKVSFELRFARGGSEERILEATARLTYDAFGRPQRMAGIAADVTERRRAEGELRERSADFERLFEASSEGILVHELMTAEARGAFLRANPAACALLGYTAEELSRLTLLDIIAPEDGAQSSPAEHELGRLEKVLLRKDGRRVLGEVSSRHFVHRGRPMVLSVIRDLTERLRSARALQESEARLRTLIDHAPAAIFFKDLAGRLVVGNRLLASLFGRTLDEVLGKRVEDLDPGTAAPFAANRRVLAGGEPESFEELVALPDGVHTFISTQFPVRGHDGIVRGLGGISVDITERKRAEDRVREADRRKTEFLAMLSHELRNPLAPIKNSLFVLDRALHDSDRAGRARAVLHRQVGHLTRLVDDLLDLTRISNGKIRLQLARLDLGILVRRTVEDYRSVFEGGGVTLTLEAPEGPVFVLGDATRLSQALGNLLQNAAKFTSGGGAAQVRLCAEEASGRAVVAIRDDGQGIEPRMLSRLFEPFTQADATLARSSGGLGLGLALVKGLIELHGGEVSATSLGLGRGAEFAAWLPLAPRSRATDGVQGGQNECEVALAAASPQRVLVIEDNVDSAESLRDVLQQHGHLVELAFDGRMGLAAARSFRPEVVLCDIGLPELDGFGVARAIRADPELSGVRLIAISGYATPEDRRSSLAAGFERHLAKPVTFEHLEEILAARVAVPE